MADNLQDKILLSDKTLTPKANRRSVVDIPALGETGPISNSLILQFAEVADEFSQWGRNVRVRDEQLRAFWPTEPMLAGAVYAAVTRNATFEWEIKNSDPSKPPHKNTINAVTRILQNSERGSGWDEFVKKVYVDLYTQDNGSFIEIIRTKNSPTAPVINLSHLDSYRCRRTGDPKTPVIYTDRKGRKHNLQWYQVITLEEFPSPIESLYGIQYCAVTRALRAAQIIRDISIYKHEKISGRNPSSLHVIGGASQTELDDVRRMHEENMNNLGVARYSPPVLFASLDPTHPVSHVQIDIASLPDSYDEQTTLQWYVTQLALAFGVDYTEFAPLPTGGDIGASSQAEILHMKTRGKGPATIMKLIEDKLNNNNILPKMVKFEFKTQDLRAEAEQADARFNRGKDRSIRLKSGELDKEAALDMAEHDGDIPPHIAAALRKRLKKQEQEENNKPELTIEPVSDITENNNESGMQFEADQVTGGVESNNEQQKAVHLDRTELLTSIRQDKPVNIDLTLPEISQEDVEAMQSIIRDRLDTDEDENKEEFEKLKLHLDTAYIKGKITRSERADLSIIYSGYKTFRTVTIPAFLLKQSDRIYLWYMEARDLFGLA